MDSPIRVKLGHYYSTKEGQIVRIAGMRLNYNAQQVPTCNKVLFIGFLLKETGVEFPHQIYYDTQGEELPLLPHSVLPERITPHRNTLIKEYPVYNTNSLVGIPEPIRRSLGFYEDFLDWYGE